LIRDMDVVRLTSDTPCNCKNASDHVILVARFHPCCFSLRRASPSKVGGGSQ
jgi:hypothetical protein